MMERILKDIRSHVLELSRAGCTLCRYTPKDDVDQYEIKQVMRLLIDEGMAVKRDKRDLIMNWGEIK